MRVIVCGDRRWTNRDAIMRRLAELPPNSEVIQGECRGADLLAKDCCDALGIKCIGYPADWDHYGRGAGPMRNQEMLDLGPDLVIAFHSDILSSRGTYDMLRRACKRGTKIEVIE